MASLGAPVSERLLRDVLPSRILVWDVETGAALTYLDAQPHESFTGGVAWSRDGNSSWSQDTVQEVLRWNMPGWKRLPSLSTWCSDYDGLKACVVEHVVFSPDGLTLFAWGIGRHSWDAATGDEQKGRRSPRHGAGESRRRRVSRSPRSDGRAHVRKRYGPICGATSPP